MSETDEIERVARAIDEAYGGVSLAFTDESTSDTPSIKRLREHDTARAIRAAQAAIDALGRGNSGSVDA